MYKHDYHAYNNSEMPKTSCKNCMIQLLLNTGRQGQGSKNDEEKIPFVLPLNTTKGIILVTSTDFKLQ